MLSTLQVASLRCGSPAHAPRRRMILTKLLLLAVALQVCGNSSLTEWVAQGHDKGSTLHGMPSDDVLIAMGRELLNIAP